jgi:hypothetical protein
MNPRDIKLSGLTYEQVEMLDIMWSLDTIDEFFNWYETLDKDDQNTVDTLQRLIILEVADAEWENTKRFPQAKAVLKQFML